MQSRFDRSARVAREARDRLSPLFSSRAHALKSFSGVEVGEGEKEGDSGSRASRASVAGGLSADEFLALIAAIQAEHGPISLSGLREADAPEDWLAHLAGFHRAVAFLSRCQLRQSKGRWPSSYTLKHQAEVLAPHTYVANGVLIAAAIALELPWINGALKYGHGQNAEVGVIVPKALQSLEPRSHSGGGGVPKS